MNYRTVTVNLTEQSMIALGQAVLTGENTRTDTINRAIQLYAHIVDGIAKGHQFAVIIDDEINLLTIK